jgi:hypothetical protein
MSKCEFCDKDATQVVMAGTGVVRVCDTCCDALEYGNEMGPINIIPIDQLGLWELE